MSAPYGHVANELPDLRLWLRDQWLTGNLFSRVAAGELDRRGPGLGNPVQYAKWERAALTDASLWWVSADMVDLLMAAAATVPDDVALDQLPRPSSDGLVVFEKPWRGHDTDKPDVSLDVNAILWGNVQLPPIEGRHDFPAAPLALAISSYQRLVFQDGLTPDELDRVARTGAINHAEQRKVGSATEVADVGLLESSGTLAVHQGRPPEAYANRTFALHGCTWAPLGRSDWPVVDALGDREWPTMADVAHVSFVEDRRILAALWTLTAQPGVADAVPAPIDRQTRRRSERHGVDGGVTVVRLRRLREHVERDGEEEPGEAQRHLTHRHYVVGHWRNARVGRGRTERRLTWVRPHIKGPAEAELVTKERVNAWVR